MLRRGVILEGDVDELGHVQLARFESGGKDSLAIFRGDKGVALERRPRCIRRCGRKGIRIVDSADAASQNRGANGNGNSPLQSQNPLRVYLG